MDEIKGIATVKFHPGKVEEWKRLTEEAIEIVRTRDSGTLQYEIFFNEDETEAVVFERYRDADAAIEHFSNISHLMGAAHGHRLRHGAKCWNAECEYERGARKGRPEAVHGRGWRCRIRNWRRSNNPAGDSAGQLDGRSVNRGPALRSNVQVLAARPKDRAT